MRETRRPTESLTFGRLVPSPENRFAVDACQRAAAGVVAGYAQRWLNPLFLHGPPGSGKTHLVSSVVHEVCGTAPRSGVAVRAAGDFDSEKYGEQELASL